jgi:hypothetical protein
LITLKCFTIELDCIAILVMCLQMNMKIHIHRQTKCLQNWGKIKEHKILREVSIQALKSIIKFKKDIASPYLDKLERNA